jgi:hypothetical protein
MGRNKTYLLIFEGGDGPFVWEWLLHYEKYSCEFSVHAVNKKRTTDVIVVVAAPATRR